MEEIARIGLLEKLADGSTFTLEWNFFTLFPIGFQLQ